MDKPQPFQPTPGPHESNSRMQLIGAGKGGKKGTEPEDLEPTRFNWQESKELELDKRIEIQIKEELGRCVHKVFIFRPKKDQEIQAETSLGLSHPV